MLEDELVEEEHVESSGASPEDGHDHSAGDDVDVFAGGHSTLENGEERKWTKKDQVRAHKTNTNERSDFCNNKHHCHLRHIRHRHHDKQQ